MIVRLNDEFRRAINDLANDLKLNAPLTCVFCGEGVTENGHAPGRKCPHVRAQVLRRDGTVKRVEFFTPRERMRVQYGDKIVEGWKEGAEDGDVKGVAAGGDAAV